MLIGGLRIDQPGETRFGKGTLKDVYYNRYWNETNFKAIDRLNEIAAECDTTLVGLSFRWLLQHDYVDSVLLGMDKIEHLVSNLEVASQGPLPEKAMEACDEVWQILAGSTFRYDVG